MDKTHILNVHICNGCEFNGRWARMNVDECG